MKGFLTIIAGFLVLNTACVPPEEVIDNVDSGTQIGAEDCPSSLLVLQLRDLENNGLMGSVAYVYENEASVTLDCPYSCSIVNPGMGVYTITAFVGETSLEQTAQLSDDDLIPATENCPESYEKVVRFEFSI